MADRPTERRVTKEEVAFIRSCPISMETHRLLDTIESLEAERDRLQAENTSLDRQVRNMQIVEAERLGRLIVLEAQLTQAEAEREQARQIHKGAIETAVKMYDATREKLTQAQAERDRLKTAVAHHFRGGPDGCQDLSPEHCLSAIYQAVLFVPFPSTPAAKES